jgi:hypothetical protein
MTELPYVDSFDPEEKDERASPSTSESSATTFRLTLLRHHRERNTVQHRAWLSKETALSMQDLQARAHPCNTRIITRNEIRSAVRVRSSAHVNRLE